MTTPTLHQAATQAADALERCTTEEGPEQHELDAAREALAALREALAAPPAAPADDHATPSGGQEAGPQEDRIEAAYWRFDARHKGYSQWKTAPMSERDAFKAEMRNALESEKVRAEMRLVARGWRRPDAPAAPAPAAPVPDGWVMVPREPTQAMCAAAVVFANGNAVYKNVLPEVLKLEEEIYGEVWSAMIAASPAAPVVLQLWCPETGELCGTRSKTGTCEASMIQAHGIGGGNG